MKYLILIPSILLTLSIKAQTLTTTTAACSVFGQDTVRLGGGMNNKMINSPLKYQLSKHTTITIKNTEYTSLFGLGDTVTTKYGFNMVIKMMCWRNVNKRFEYQGEKVGTTEYVPFIMENDLKLK